MSTFDNFCILCSSPVLSDVLSRAEGCRFRGNQDSYAALATHMNPTALPVTSCSSFMGASFDRAPCTVADEIVSTVTVVCASLESIGIFVHVVDEGYSDPQELVDITERSSNGRTCIVVSVSPVSEDGSKSCTVYTSSSPEGARMPESSAIGVLLSLQLASKSAVWYWSAELFGYSSALNNSTDSLWILSLTPGCANSSVLDSRPMIPSSKKGKMKVMPFFYCTLESPSMVLMGKGGVDKICRDDLSVELTALSRVIVDRAYCSTASTGRCFCCQYLCNVHSERHKVHDETDMKFKLSLTEQFWQKTKGTNNGEKQQGVGH